MTGTIYKRQTTAMERLFTRSPFSLVTMVARIKGEVTEEAWRAAVDKVRQRHTNLRVRLEDDAVHNPWLTTEGAAAIPIELIRRHSPDQWIRVVRETGKVPFDFEKQTPIRFILIRSDEISELIVLCHHILCDGMSLAYVVRDLLEHLGDSSRAVTVLPSPAPISPETMPEGLSLNALVRYAIRRINRKWEADPVYFDQQDYELLTDAYWEEYEHELISVELSQAETTELVERCRREQVTVNTALTAAFTAAQSMVLGDERYEPKLGVAADLRSRLQQAAGEGMGFYAGVATHSYRHDPKMSFWDNARVLHSELREGFTDEILFKEPLTWSLLSPSILDAINFKKLGSLVPEQAAGSGKLRAFSRRKDVVQGILKRDKMDSLDRVFMGTAITNLTRLDFPTNYGHLELERMIMKPGGAFPLGNVNLVVGAVTAAGRLSLAVEYVENNIANETMETIKKTALGLLLDNHPTGGEA